MTQQVQASLWNRIVCWFVGHDEQVTHDYDPLRDGSSCRAFELTCTRCKKRILVR